MGLRAGPCCWARIALRCALAASPEAREVRFKLYSPPGRRTQAWSCTCFCGSVHGTSSHVVGPSLTGSPPTPQLALKAALILPGAHATAHAS